MFRCKNQEKYELPYIIMLTAIFLKKCRGLNQFYGEVSIQIVNISPIEPRSANRSHKRSRIMPTSPDNNNEDEDDQWKRELNEALEAIDEIRDSDLDSYSQRDSILAE